MKAGILATPAGPAEFSWGDTVWSTPDIALWEDSSTDGIGPAEKVCISCGGCWYKPWFSFWYSWYVMECCAALGALARFSAGRLYAWWYWRRGWWGSFELLLKWPPPVFGCPR